MTFELCYLFQHFFTIGLSAKPLAVSMALACSGVRLVNCGGTYFFLQFLAQPHHSSRASWAWNAQRKKASQTSRLAGDCQFSS
jgi:hypothetical protein